MSKFDVLIDGSHLAHRANHVFQNLETSTHQPTGLIYGFLQTLYSLKQRFQAKDGDFIIFWDGKPIVKRVIFPEYKAQREHSNIDSFSRQVFFLKGVLFSLGIGQVQVEFEEADDLISSYVHKYKDSKKLIIYSADHDFLQLINDRVIMVKPKMGVHPEVVYNSNLVLKEFGVDPRTTVFLKVFCGDSSDNIPGVYRLPKKQLIKILQTVSIDGFQTIEEIFKNLKTFDFLTPHQISSIEQFYEQAFKNFELIKLKEHLEVEIQKGTFDSTALEKEFVEIQFSSFLRNFNQWVKLFGGGQVA